MSDDKYIVKSGKAMRFGYTTGSCATAAATAAAQMLLDECEVNSVCITLPNGEKVEFIIEDICIKFDSVTCCVTKDAGDDPDVTDGIKIYVQATFCDIGINILGGVGIGVVTTKGLQCDVGEPAINPVPKKMITQNVSNVFEMFHYKKGMNIKLFVPNGEEIAKKTFNARLSIIGGISILGTTGIVEPMSEKALVDTIKVLIDKQYEIDKAKILISPGNYGREYCKNNLNIDIDKGVKYSNFIGETLDYLVYKGFSKVLIVGHIGKLVKLAGGIMNTHSSVADCRMEIIAVHCGLAGANLELIQNIMHCVTTDEAILLLEQNGFCEVVMKSIMEKIKFRINYRVHDKLQAEIIIFSNSNKIIAKSENAFEFAKMFVEEKEITS
jgi:cobalt-precorrin-5B (C1)-methyltransferase